MGGGGEKKKIGQLITSGTYSLPFSKLHNHSSIVCQLLGCFIYWFHPWQHSFFNLGFNIFDVHRPLEALES